MASPLADQQFRRSLDEHLGLIVSDDDFEALVHKYGRERKGMMNYRAFENSMENGTRRSE